LAGKVAVVTGGAQGIGLAIGRRFGAEGAAVVVADVDEERGEAAAASLRGGGVQALFVATDVSHAGQVARLFTRALAAFGQVDILVNNAGLVHGPAVERHFLDTDEATWDRVVAVNLKGVYLCSWHAAHHMVRRRTGCIISMSSCGATRAHRHRVAYDATKGAIEAATRAMALDLAPWGIRVNAIAPGAIAVERRSPVGEEGQVAPGDVIPLARLGTGDDVAGAAVYLASDDAAYLTGVVVTVDGGLSAQLRSPAVDVKVAFGG
jgi:3-oxoacyl-[acyl-carrier protein] reductase